MFRLRFLPVVTLLASCSVYSESILGSASSAESGGASSRAGAAGFTLGQSGSPAAGGSKGNEGHGGAEAPNAAGVSSGTSGESSATGGAGQSAGASGLAGSADMAGASTGGAAPTGTDLLDDMEDGNFSLLPKPPRFGYWYVAGDATVGAKLPKIEQLIGALDPARLDPPHPPSTESVHFTASGFKDWGASVGLTFADAAQKRTAYDSGNAVGISFWVRGSITDNAKLKVLFPLVGTDPMGKLCGGTNQGLCLDHFSAQVDVTSQWQQRSVLFTSAHQAGWGVPLTKGFDPSQMLGIEWNAGTANVDIWIDDLALIRP